MTAPASASASRPAPASETPVETATERVLAADRTPVLLDVLMALSVLGGLGTTWALARDPRVPVAWAPSYLAVVLAMALLWTARRIRERRTGQPGRPFVAGLAVLGVVNLGLGGGAGAWPLFLLALVATVGCFGRRTGLVLCLAVLVMQLVVMLRSGTAVADALLEVGATAFVSAFGVLVAWLLTERVRQQRRIAVLLDEVRAGLAAEVELVLADERTRAARDLHDGLGHRLTLIGMQLSYAERARDRDPAGAWAQVGRARSEASDALTSMRRWVRALSPARVDDVGLAAGLDALAQSFRGTGLDVVVHDVSVQERPGPAVLDRASTLFVHRFVQEALTNALRHGCATSIEVAYALDGGRLRLAVSDDGTPGPARRPGPAPGFGLRNLAERARELGGHVETGWSADGFRLVAELPTSPARS